MVVFIILDIQINSSSERAFLLNSIKGISLPQVVQLRGSIELPIPPRTILFKRLISLQRISMSYLYLISPLPKNLYCYINPTISSDVPSVYSQLQCHLLSSMTLEYAIIVITYTPKNKPKPLSELINFIEKYKVNNEPVSCIVPFSGGRDSTYTLHYLKKELNLNPIAYTYDWGMVTDLGRRNISRVCSQLSVENIIVAANIRKKRAYIKKNLAAFLHKPDLAMLNILTAGDKHFFRHVNTVCKETSIPLNIWGISPLEITHFKSGFLGIKPQFSALKTIIQVSPPVILPVSSPS